MTTLIEAMAARILAVYDRATPFQRTEGRDWYPRAGAIVSAIAYETGSHDPRTIAMVLAALSPRNPWRWNVADAFAYAVAAAERQARPSATTFKRNQEAAWAALSLEDPWVTAAPKVRAFVEAIMGDQMAVVVDIWATRVAGGDGIRQPDERNYATFVDAYVRAAGMTGESPRDMQAITWLVAQTEGIGSGRRGRPDLSFKRGTHPTVLGLFGQPVQLDLDLS